jgi:Trypsin-co-occurring domain 1
LVEAVQQAGSEPTAARAQDAVEHVSSAFTRAQDAIIEVAKSRAEVIQKAAERSISPDRVEVELGMRFSASGRIIVAGVAGEATLKVVLSYDAKGSGEAAVQ